LKNITPDLRNAGHLRGRWPYGRPCFISDGLRFSRLGSCFSVAIGDAATAKGVTVDSEKSPAAKACDAAAKSCDAKAPAPKGQPTPKPPTGKPFFQQRESILKEQMESFR